MHSETTDIVKLSLLIFSGIFLLLSGFVIFIVFKYKQKQNLYYRDLENLKAQHENVLLQARIEMQERTFLNISREIHDNIGQKLALLKLRLLSEPDKNILAELAIQVSEIISDLRDISRSLNGDIVLSNGLIPSIEFEVDQLRKTNLFKVEFSITGEADFINEEREVILIRILQEALQNILKHSKAKKIILAIHYSVNTLTLTIKDNGMGFIKEKSAGQGLKNMEDRTKLLGGNYFIETSLMKGVSIVITIPLHHESAK